MALQQDYIISKLESEGVKSLVKQAKAEVHTRRKVVENLNQLYREARQQEKSQQRRIQAEQKLGEQERRRITALINIQKLSREVEELEGKKQERISVLEGLPHRIDEVCKKIEKVEDLYKIGSDLCLKDADAEQVCEDAEREKKEGLEKDAQIRLLEKEYNDLKQKKQKRQHQLQRHTIYKEFLEQVLKSTNFRDVQHLREHSESLVKLKDQHFQKEDDVQDQIHRLKKELLKLKDKEDLLGIRSFTQLAQLRNELQSTSAEVQKLEREWNKFQETATQKTLLLGQIKMASFNFYEMIYNIVGGESLDINDTDSQLDKVKMFIVDYMEIIKQYEMISNRFKDEQRVDQTKNTEINKALIELLQQKERIAQEQERQLKSKLKSSLDMAMKHEQEKILQRRLYNQPVKDQHSEENKPVLPLPQPRVVKRKSKHVSAANKVVAVGHSCAGGQRQGTGEPLTRLGATQTQSAEQFSTEKKLQLTSASRKPPNTVGVMGSTRQGLKREKLQPNRIRKGVQRYTSAGVENSYCTIELVPIKAPVPTRDIKQFLEEKRLQFCKN